ncbi:MAG: hypothetical protein LBB39_00605 [Mycoplasmataceae bacterium]|nr:hypothetical protein [Mycoplasmataceae bacterium]
MSPKVNIAKKNKKSPASNKPKAGIDFKFFDLKKLPDDEFYDYLQENVLEKKVLENTKEYSYTLYLLKTLYVVHYIEYKTPEPTQSVYETLKFIELGIDKTMKSRIMQNVVRVAKFRKKTD